MSSLLRKPLLFVYDKYVLPVNASWRSLGSQWAQVWMQISMQCSYCVVSAATGPWDTLLRCLSFILRFMSPEINLACDVEMTRFIFVHQQLQLTQPFTEKTLFGHRGHQSSTCCLNLLYFHPQCPCVSLFQNILLNTVPLQLILTSGNVISKTTLSFDIYPLQS
jgi:hypothetical protein